MDLTTLGINFRKRTEEEIRESVDEYIASKDYLEYVNAKRLEYGYKDGKNSLENIQNIFKTVKHEGEIEGKSVVINTRANFLKAMKNMNSNSIVMSVCHEFHIFELVFCQ